MQSKRSFFNVTLFRKNLTRFWPLWGGLSIAGAFIPLYMMLELATRTSQHMQPGDFTAILYGAATMFAPAFIMGYAVLCAMLVWNYLYSPRAVGLMHTLPVSRTCLFVTNTLSGLTIMAIPFVVVGGLMSLVALFFGIFDLLAVVQTIAAVIFMSVMFFGLATLCAMLTGHTAVMPVLYLLVNFLAEIIESMVTYLSSALLMGVSSYIEGRLLFLTPLLYIYSRFEWAEEAVYSGDGPRMEVEGWKCTLTGLGTVALYALVGLVLLALAWLLYQKRQSERAGDIVAYRPLQPVFRYGVALLSALTLGQLLNELFWEALYIDAPFTDLVPVTICMIIAGVIGYYIASMLLEKSLRVFQGSWKGVLTLCAAIVILCVGASLDPLGLEYKVPDLDDIMTVEVYGSMNSMDFDTSTERGRELTAQVVEIHQAVLADKDYICSTAKRNRSYGHISYGFKTDGDEKSMGGSLSLQYMLKDGSTLRRYYTLPITETRMKDPNTYDGKVYRLTHTDEVLTQQVYVPEGSLLRINVYASGWNIEGGDDFESIYDALLQDAREGHIDGSGFPYWESEEETTRQYMNTWLEIMYTVQRDGQSDVESKGVDLRSDMTHTIDALVAGGYLTREQLTALENGTFDYNDYDMELHG